jgi:predicted permease
MGELWRRIWYLLNRTRFERELAEEMDAHRAMKGDDEPRFGNMLRLREDARDQWGWSWLDALAQDLRFASRLLTRSPAFTLTAVGVLALGVGLNLAAFQLMDLVALSSLPVRAPETLVKLHHRNPRGMGTSFSYPAFDFYRNHQSSFSATMGLAYGDVTLEDGENQRVRAEFVTANYLSELGATPLLGRLLDPGDDAASAPPAVVLSERLWQSRFGADPSVVGRTLRLNRRPFTIAGVTSGMFVGIGDEFAAAWIPITQHPAAFAGSVLLEDWKGAPVRFYARLREGVGPEAAEAELTAVASGLRSLRPDDVPEDERLVTRPAGQFVSLEEAGPMFALTGSLVALILIVACMNLGVLLLSRNVSRDREFAIRLSVGAARSRLVRQLLTEYMLLGLIGTAAAGIVSTLSTHAVLGLIGAPPGLTPQFNARVAAVAVGLAILSSLAVGLGPAWQALRPLTARRQRLRGVLLGVQVAAATTLLIVSTLLVRGVTRIARIPLGFDYQQTLVADAGLSSHGVTPAAALEYWRTANTRIRQVPGVRNVALTTLPPFGNRVTVNRERTVFYHVTASYFDTMQIAVKRGRIFSDGESDVALISESLARRRWPGEDAIGKVYEGATVIGIVTDARTVRLSEQNATECYQAIAPAQMAGSVIVVRADDPSGAVVPIRATLREADARLTPSIVLLRDAFASFLEAPMRVAKIASAIGVCALLLAVTGLAGMVAFAVSQRLREIGIRVALGARPSHVLVAIARAFTIPIACGAVAGSGLAAIVATVLSREMFGVGRLDPIAHGGAFLLFAVVAAAASLPSLRRALRVDPIATLRHE